jgi:hypothetical protein
MNERELEDMILRRAVAGNSNHAIAYALLRIAHETAAIASALRMLGNADAATPMGAIEALGKVIEEGFGRLADALPDESGITRS